MQTTMRATTIWLTLVTSACASPVAVEASVPPQPPAADAPPAPTSTSTSTPTSTSTSTSTSTARADAPEAARSLPSGQRKILDAINDRYKTQTDAAQWSESFERVGREVHDRQRDILAELGVAPGSTVADVGAGTGLYTLPFAAAVGPKGRVYAVDIQSYFLDHIRQRATEAGYDHVTTVMASASSAELPADAIDLVFMCDAYHHLQDPGRYLASLRASLHSDGRLAIIDYRRGEPGTWRHDHIRADPNDFRAEIEAAGFVLEREVTLLDDNFFFVFRRA